MDVLVPTTVTQTFDLPIPTTVDLAVPTTVYSDIDVPVPTTIYSNIDVAVLTTVYSDIDIPVPTTIDVPVPTTMFSDVLVPTTVDVPVPTTVFSDLPVPTTVYSNVDVPVPTTIIELGTTLVIPASTITSIVTTSLAGVTSTLTQGGSTVVSIQPGVTTTFTTTLTITQAGQTVTQAGRTTTVAGQTTTETLPGPGATVTLTQSIITCPMPTNSAPVTPQATGEDATWGCLPGYVCSPPKPDSCDLFANPPDPNYVCDQAYCIQAPAFNDVQWPSGHTSFYPAIEGYFNLNPEDFGLSFDIFAEQIISTIIAGVPTAYTTGNWSSQAFLGSFSATSGPSTPQRKPRSLAKRGNTVPSVCYADCNNCFIEAQKVGKSSSLCASNSPFESDLGACQACVANNGDAEKVTLQNYVDPEFAQFLDFCSAQAPESELAPLSTSTSTETVSPLPVSSTSVVLVNAVTTAATPTIAIQVTSQVSANSNTSPFPISTSTPTPTVAPQSSKTSVGVAASLPSSSGSGSVSVPVSGAGAGSSSSTSTTTGPTLVTTNSSNILVPSNILLYAIALMFAFCTYLV